MAHDSAENYHPVPAIRRMREKSAMGGKAGSDHEAKPKEHGHGTVTRTEVEKHKDGSAHVVAHHEDGHAEVHEHPDEKSAHTHAEQLMSGHDAGAEEGGSGQGDEEGLAEQSLGGEPEGGAEEGGEAGGEEEECPNCGAQMEGDTCPQCGYKEKASGKGQEEEGGEGY